MYLLIITINVLICFSFYFAGIIADVVRATFLTRDGQVVHDEMPSESIESDVGSSTMGFTWNLLSRILMHIVSITLFLFTLSYLETSNHSQVFYTLAVLKTSQINTCNEIILTLYAKACNSTEKELHRWYFYDSYF